VWWTFKVFGHKRVFVLDGGFPAWQRSGGLLETSPPMKYSAATYLAPAKNDDLVRSFEEITDLARRRDKGVQILDARSSGRFQNLFFIAKLRFHGSDPEPREGVSRLSCRLIIRSVVRTYPRVNINAFSDTYRSQDRPISRYRILASIV